LYTEIFAKVRSRNAKDTGEYYKYFLDNPDEYRDKVTLIPNGIFKFQIYNNPRLPKSLPVRQLPDADRKRWAGLRSLSRLVGIKY
jgi:hypothetical protein